VKTQLVKTNEILNDASNKEFVNIFESKYVKLAVQKIDGKHNFRHINNTSDEHIIVLDGKFRIWTEQGEVTGTSGDIISIPKRIEHGDIFGEKARIIVLENITNRELSNG